MGVFNSRLQCKAAGIFFEINSKPGALKEDTKSLPPKHSIALRFKPHE